MAYGSSHIPHAIDTRSNSKQYIKPYDANLYAERGRYICVHPECTTPLMIYKRKGKCFFRHYPVKNNTCAGGAQTLHKNAIKQLRNHFLQVNKSTRNIPTFVIETIQGEKEIVPLLSSFVVKTEYPLNGRKIDLAILDKLGNPILLIEILNTSKVTNAKSIDLAAFAWLEIKADAVMQNPSRLKVENFNLPQHGFKKPEQVTLFD